MISIDNIDSFIRKSYPLNKSVNQKNPQFQLEENSKKNHQVSTYSSEDGLNSRPYNLFAKNAKLKFSAQSAINQYHSNKNYEAVEKTKFLFGLSVYA